jgi:hypothetical protein
MERSSVIYMNRVDAKSNVIYMNRVPARSSVIYMTPVDGQGGGGEGGGDENISWVLHGYGAFWPTIMTSPIWNMSPGDFSSATVNNPVGTYSGWKYMKFVPHTGVYYSHWTNSTGGNVYTFQYKSTISAGNLGETIMLGPDGKWAIGFLDANPAACTYGLGTALYLGK